MQNNVKVGDKIRILTQETSGHFFKKDSIVTVSRLNACGGIEAVGMTYMTKECTEEYKDRSQVIYAADYEVIPSIDYTKPVQTKDGEKVKILSTEGRGDYTVIGYVGDSKFLSTFTKEGRYSKGEESIYDLENVPEKLEYYFNVYKTEHGNFISPPYALRETADKHAGENRVGVKRVEFNVGEFDE